ncbi:MAG: hypothetical protein KDD70_09285 [Bdellovibrionales bacterium]|nr:hypothetical protein [Bdellovibrionales bacterium]
MSIQSRIPDYSKALFYSKSLCLQRAFSLLAILLLASGCSSINRTPPDVSLVDVQFGEVALFETTLTVTTRISNVTNEPLSISGMVHELSLNGIRLGKAVSNENFRLGALESEKVTSKLELSHLKLAFNLQDLINSPKLDYELNSEFFLSGQSLLLGLGGGSIKVQNSGTLISGSRQAAKASPY